MEWIASDGGPLICVETAYARTWGGVDRLTPPFVGEGNDYDRACKSNAYTFALSFGAHTALILSMGPLDTSFWIAPSGAFCLVSVVCAEPDIDEPKKLALIDETMFDRPQCTTDILFETGDLMMFDSAYPGDEADGRSLRFSISPGRYLVLSNTFEPDQEISFIVHQFRSVQPAS